MSVLSAIVDFLRVGYPEGVPQQDYIPLLALLRRQLTDDEVREVVASLAGEANPDSAAIDRAISQRHERGAAAVRCRPGRRAPRSRRMATGGADEPCHACRALGPCAVVG